jgi:hypothetical protein
MLNSLIRIFYKQTQSAITRLISTPPMHNTNKRSVYDHTTDSLSVYNYPFELLLCYLMLPMTYLSPFYNHRRLTAQSWRELYSHIPLR